MEIKKTELIKLVASEGKLLINKEPQYDEEGNEIKQEGSKIIYLARNSNPEDYIEISESSQEENKNKKDIW